MQRFRVALLLSISFFTAGSADQSVEAGGPRFLESRKGLPATHGPDASIRADVNMTLVPVTVMDQRGRYVRGLRRSNFRILDGAGPLSIAAFTQEDAPLSVGLIFDSSGSMSNKFDAARGAATELLRQLHSEDESFIVTVSYNAALAHGFTSNVNDIGSALLFTHANGTTSLLDGVYLGITEMKKARNPRRALIVVSDGGDNRSRYTLRDLLNLAAESDTLIYGIGVFLDPQSQEEVNGPDLLARLSDSTGGLTFTAHDPESVRAAISYIAASLRNQYVLGYYPPPIVADGKYHKVHIQLILPKGTPKLQVYSRRGYYAPER